MLDFCQLDGLALRCSADASMESIGNTLNDTTATALASDAQGLPISASAWSRSRRKRYFDVACVVISLPVFLPILIVTAFAVRITSSGPVLFRQQRIGRFGLPFTILKFRTMLHIEHSSDRPLITTSTNQRFTPIGRFLRHWKLDELPQLFNVLFGDMSLVGPRPKLVQHQGALLECRPGITGYATCVFAREESRFAGIPEDTLNLIHRNFVLPLKNRLDREYMANASFRSDLQLVFRSALRDWNDDELDRLVKSAKLTGPQKSSSDGSPINTVYREPIESLQLREG